MILPFPEAEADLCEFEASQGYIAKRCLDKTKNKTQTNKREMLERV